MRVVVDTNVLVSGLLGAYTGSGEIVRMISSGSLKLCHDSRILEEYREVLLRPKFPFQKSDIEFFLDKARSSGQAVAAQPLGFSLVDPDDEPFLEVALSGKARFLITGNLKDYSRYRGNTPDIVSPGDFLKIYKARS